MSDQRLAWTDSEKALLVETRHGIPRATVEELTQVFNMSNHRKRSSIAVRTKLRTLGLAGRPRSSIRCSTMPASLRGLDLLSRPKVDFRVSAKPANPPQQLQQSFNRPLTRYDGIVPELGIFLPLHPLLAEARQYASKSQIPGYCEELRIALPWPPTLGMGSISELKCGEKDKRVLQQYMDYLQSWKSTSP